MVKQRGSALGIKIVYLVYKVFGFWVMKLLLRFVAFYFALTTPKIKKDLSKIYTLCGKKYGFWEHFEHIYSFALVFTDRFLSKIDSINYSFELQNEAIYTENSKHPMMMFTAHLGDWHVCTRALPKTGQKMNVVMKEAVKKDVREFQNKITNKEEYNTIDISEGFFSYGVKIANALKNNEAVSIMVDRFNGAGKEVVFFGKKLLFHDTPFSLAYSQQAKMVAIFSFRVADFKYKIIFEEIHFDTSISKEESIRQAMQEYAFLLERYTKEYTSQWFNHYDIFGITAA